MVVWGPIDIKITHYKYLGHNTDKQNLQSKYDTESEKFETFDLNLVDVKKLVFSTYSQNCIETFNVKRKGLRSYICINYEWHTLRWCIEDDATICIEDPD